MAGPNHKKDAAEETAGGLVISGAVIAAIALNAAKEAEGVAGFAAAKPGVKNLLAQADSPLKSVRVEAGENGITLHIYLIVREGVKIPQITAQVQKNVKSAVQNMTGKVVSKVNINIAGIGFAPAEGVH